MCLFLRGFLALLLNIHASLSENETNTDVDNRWVTRPPYDKDFTFSVVIVMSQAADETCSGTLLTLEWVLTAARCMYKGDEIVETKTSLTVYAGVDKRLDDTVRVQNRTSKELKIRRGKGGYYGVALVKVEPPFKREKGGKDIKPFHDPYPSGYQKGSGHGRENICLSTSFGRIVWDVERHLTLKKTLVVVQPCNCSQALREAFPDAPVEQWMCGEDGHNMGLCKGDFGAALTKCEKDAMGIAIGIVSFSDMNRCVIKEKESKECDETNTISIYTDLCYHLDWINRFVSSVPANTSSCDAPGSATPVRENSWHLILVYFFIAASVS